MEQAKDECGKRHPLQGDNKRVIRHSDGTTSVCCRECARARVRAYQQRQRQKLGLPPPRPYRRREVKPADAPRPARWTRKKKTVCKHGHPLSGENVKIIRNSNGTTKQRCVKCERNSSREYQRRERAKSPKARPQTLAEKIANSYDIAGDCHIWNAKLDKGHPTISQRKRYTRVRKLMYVARYGALKHVSDTAVTCGQPLCVNPAHIAGMQRELRLARDQIGARIMTCWEEIVRYARQRTHGKFDPDDIALAAVAATYERLQSGTEIDNLIGFMCKAVRNAIIDQARRFTIAPMTALADDHDTIASPAETTDPMLICEQDEYRSDRRKHYAQVLRRIGYRSKQAARVLRLRIGGLSAQQIGDKLGITVHTVERHMNTARRIALPNKQMERPHPHEPIAAVLR